MVSLDDHLNDPLYANWVRNTLALNFVNSVLQPYVYGEVVNLHKSIISRCPAGVTCGSCSWRQASRCPNNFCDIIKNEIEDNHRYGNPSFSNTNARHWKSDAWEVAKCFMPLSGGYRNCTSSSADFSATVNIVMNCKTFDALVLCDLDNSTNIFSKATILRNDLMHSKKLKISEYDIQSNLDLLMSLLNDIKTKPTNFTEALDKIAKLKAGKLKITVQDVLDARTHFLLENGATKQDVAEKIAKLRQEIKEGASNWKVSQHSLIDNFVKGSKYSLVKILESHIDKVKHERCPKQKWNFSKFLDGIEGHPDISSLHQRHRLELYPDDGVTADIHDLDLFLLCHLLSIELSVPLDNNLKAYIRELIRIRDKILRNLQNIAVTDLEEVAECLEEPLRTEVLKIYHSEGIIDSALKLQSELTSWQQSEESMENKQISNKALQQAEKQATRINELEKKIDQLLEQLGNKTEIRTNPERRDQGIETNVQVKPKHCNKKEEEQVQDNMTSEDEAQNIFLANGGRNDFCEKLHVKTAQPIKGSIILKVTCESIKDLVRFWHSCMDGSALRALSKGRDDYRKFLGCETLDFDIILTKKEVNRCMEYLIDRLSSRMSDISVLEKVLGTQTLVETVSGESSVMASSQTGKSGGGESTTRAEKIMTIFQQLAEVLENTEIVTIKGMITKILNFSKNRNDDGIHEVCLEVLKILEYRNGIPVHLMKQAIRCFLFMRDDPEILGKAVSERYMEMVLKDYPALAADMKLTDEMLKEYFNLLNVGFEESKHIRLMVVGMFSVGKTTLVRRLCKMDASPPPVSTVGIDILLKSCEVDDNKDWIVTQSNDRQPHFHERLQALLTKFPRKTERELSSELPDTFVEQKSQRPFISPLEICEEEESRFDVFQKKIGKRMQVEKDYYVKLKDIFRKPKEIKMKPSVSIWDFAGQSVYYSTHHFFLNARSIYLLVLDLSKSLEDEVTEVDSDESTQMFGNLILENTMEKFTCLDAFKFWMKSIFVYTQQKQAASERVHYKPTIVLIGTHRDKVTKKHLKGKSYEHYMDSYFDKALESFRNTDIIELVHPKRFFVSKDGEDQCFLEIREEIYNIASKTPFWREKIPAAFIPLEKIVFEKKTQNQEIVQFGDLVKMNEEAEYKLNEKEEIKLFLKFQHALGNLLYYDIEGFNEMIILTPQWIINVFKLFVTHKQCMTQNLQGWRDFRNLAKLSPDLIDALLSDANMSIHKQEIIKYMEQLDVIAKPVTFLKEEVDSSGLAMSQQNERKVFTQGRYAEKFVEKDCYIMPCMLRKRPKADTLKTYFESGKIIPPTLCIFIKKGFLPPFVFHRILASCIREFPIASVLGEYCLFYGIGTFELSWTRRFTLWSVDNIIYLRVSFDSLDETHEDRITCCMTLKDDLEKLIQKVFSIHGGYYLNADKTDLFDYMIKCPYCPSQVSFEKDPEDMHNLFSVTNLDFREEMTCPFCTKLVKAQEVMEYWFSGREILATDYDAEKTKLLQKNPSDAVLANLAEEIVDYQNLAEKLKMEDRDLTKIKLYHGGRTKSDLTYHILYEWKTRRNCCYKILYDAMKDAECDTTNFFQIIAEEESEEEKETVEKHLSTISNDENYNLTEQQIRKLSECVGAEYWLFGVRLGLEEKEVQQIVFNHKGNLVQQVYHILQQWNNRHRPFRELILAMVKSSCDFQEILEVFQRKPGGR